MLCSKCAAKLPDNSTFCMYCGKDPRISLNDLAASGADIDSLKQQQDWMGDVQSKKIMVERHFLLKYVTIIMAISCFFSIIMLLPNLIADSLGLYKIPEFVRGSTRHTLFGVVLLSNLITIFSLIAKIVATIVGIVCDDAKSAKTCMIVGAIYFFPTILGVIGTLSAPFTDLLRAFGDGLMPFCYITGAYLTLRRADAAAREALVYEGASKPEEDSSCTANPFEMGYVIPKDYPLECPVPKTALPQKAPPEAKPLPQLGEGYTYKQDIPFTVKGSLDRQLYPSGVQNKAGQLGSGYNQDSPNLSQEQAYNQDSPYLSQ